MAANPLPVRVVDAPGTSEFGAILTVVCAGRTSKEAVAAVPLLSVALTTPGPAAAVIGTETSMLNDPLVVVVVDGSVTAAPAASVNAIATVGVETLVAG